MKNSPAEKPKYKLAESELSPEDAALTDSALAAYRAKRRGEKLWNGLKDLLYTAADEETGEEATGLLTRCAIIHRDHATLTIGERTTYDYPPEITALEELVRTLKDRAKNGGGFVLEADCRTLVRVFSLADEDTLKAVLSDREFQAECELTNGDGIGKAAVVKCPTVEVTDRKKPDMEPLKTAAEDGPRGVTRLLKSLFG